VGFNTFRRRTDKISKKPEDEIPSATSSTSKMAGGDATNKSGEGGAKDPGALDHLFHKQLDGVDHQALKEEELLRYVDG
jgi:hypothetical protein